jgi:hypothetical protein
MVSMLAALSFEGVLCIGSEQRIEQTSAEIYLDSLQDFCDWVRCRPRDPASMGGGWDEKSLPLHNTRPISRKGTQILALLHPMGPESKSWRPLWMTFRHSYQSNDALGRKFIVRMNLCLL